MNFIHKHFASDGIILSHQQIHTTSQNGVRFITLVSKLTEVLNQSVRLLTSHLN